MKKALVLFSGGQDSTFCLAWALKNFDYVETIGFGYGQRHAVELECRKKVLEEIKTFPFQGTLGEDHFLTLDCLSQISDTALTSNAEIKMNENGLPSTFVPGRNILFMTYASALAYRRGISNIVTGVCETDYSGYPDCRDDTIKSLQVTLSLAMESEFVFHTPIMRSSKAEIWKMTEELGGKELVNLVVDETHTCYKGEHTIKHAWGYGCGECPACNNRKVGWEEYSR